ncbi:RNA polymerase sigma factor [Corynebacterium epidermidicanis]|uniref:RNA polymerase sigma factor, sigma-70 family n=1 Tax=Corynebacterium epidermidicanis TaxID=1050174 RepID=A0A0G3GRW3_9CORY|nr:sigma-70 family RNA polymerase sigma factor [Corynebacterium epidermidicanis]AKK03859.1 RNA polymerase sigma factor, sigma-70 family [Corynebacterium epidermidicanis]
MSKPLFTDDTFDQAEVLARAQAGDERAFATLARSAQSRMWAVCLSITGNRHDAEDALQNALTAAWQNLHRFDGQAKFSTWAYRIAANAALQIVRKRRDIPDDEAGLAEVDNSSPVDAQVTAGLVVKAALATLPEEFREVIVLREYAGLSYQDIADHQGIPVQTVKSRINRARAKLLDALRDAGVSPA